MATAWREGSQLSSLDTHTMQNVQSSASDMAAVYSPTPTRMPITDEAQRDAAVVRPLILKPSFMMTPAHKKPMPVRMPCITRERSPLLNSVVLMPPYQKWE